MSEIYLSVIIPAYNEENRLPATLQQIADFLASQDYTAEVLVIENGSNDRTLEVAQVFAEAHPGFKAISHPERGKGLAVQKGMLAAQGEHRFMCDADLSMPIREISRFLPPELGKADVAIASREAPGSVRYDEPAYRHIGGRLINTMIRWMALPGLQDTQCGFKCFKADAAKDLFSHQTMPGLSFDIEILYIARLRGYRIVEVPIPWYFSPESKVSAVRDALRMFRDVLAIRKNARLGRYD